MPFLKSPIYLAGPELHARLEPLHSGCTSTGGEPGHFAAQNPNSVVRYKIALPEVATSKALFFSLAFSINVRAGRATHFSVVNQDVTDGHLWEMQPVDGTGSFTLNGTLNGPLGHIVAYVNVDGPGEGALTLLSLTIAPLDETRPLRIAFVIDPWIERSDPSWKSDYIWWFGKLDTALRSTGQSVESFYLIGDSMKPLWESYRPSATAHCATIAAAKLIALYGSQRQGVVDQRRRLEADGKPPQRTALVELFRSAIPWIPDVIIAMSDIQLLKDAFPQSFILYRDALYCRAPFQDELTSFDTGGIYSNSSAAEFASKIEHERSFPAGFVESFYPRSPRILAILHRHGLADGQFLLLPLQDSLIHGFFDECNYGDQVELTIATATQFPNRRILITQHPGNLEIQPNAMSALKARYPNLAYAPELEAFNNPSARALPYAAGIAAVSTGLVYQALILGLPVIFMGKHALRAVLQEGMSAEARVQIAYRLLTHFFASYRYLHDGKWFLTRLFALELRKRGQLEINGLAIDLPGNVFKYLNDAKRPLDPPA